MRILFIVIFLFSLQKLRGQTNQELFQLNIKKTAIPIKIDGLLDEKVWEETSATTNFLEKYPRNETFSKTKTEVKVTYDEHFIYFGFTCFQEKPFIISSLKREIALLDNDGVMVVLDPVNKKNNGFSFVVNAYGVQGDGLLIGGDGPNLNWDGKWYAEVHRSADRYTVEMAIPFKTLRFEDNKAEWGINFVRSNLQIGEYSTWAKVPLQFEGYDLGYTGKLVWDAAPKRQKRNMAIIPYINAAYTKTENDNGTYDIVKKPNVGFDAKIALSSSLNLDVTTNPDFSQVDVDQQVTNLTRFNIFFPERRFFFLENSDMFAGFGIPPLRPFFSRTIGLDKDGLPTPILYGARLTGNVGATTRIGLMNVHTLGKNGDAGQNVSIASMQQNIKGRSYCKAFFLNRQGFDDSKKIQGDFSRNAGLENVYISNNGKWSAWLNGHTSYKPKIKDKNAYLQAGMLYAGENVFFLLDGLGCQENYFSDQGFNSRIENYDAVRDTSIRLGFNQVYSEGSYTRYPKKENAWFQSQKIGYENYVVINPNGTFNERNTNLGIEISTRNLFVFGAGASNVDVALPYPVSFTDGQPLPVARYRYSSVSASFETDRRKSLLFRMNVNGGGFYNGSIRSTAFGATYRARPWGNFELNFEYNDIKLPENYGSDVIALLGTKMEINFSRKLFWTSFVQLNTQNERFNFNSRLQWRFKPLSDVFLVYTDNYSSLDWRQKYRALVFKVNYWLN